MTLCRLLSPSRLYTNKYCNSFLEMHDSSHVFPLCGSVLVRTTAQNPQSAGSAGDGPSDSNNFPAWLEARFLFSYHSAAAPARHSRAQTTAVVQLQGVEIVCVHLSTGRVCARPPPLSPPMNDRRVNSVRTERLTSLVA